MARGATPIGIGVRRNTSLRATFFEHMDRTTLTKATFKLFKVNSDGTMTRLANVMVTPSTDGLSVPLNPSGTSSTLLAKNTRYKAAVTTGSS